jgi:hypothetical protein
MSVGKDLGEHVLLIYGSKTTMNATEILLRNEVHIVVFELDEHIPPELKTRKIIIRTFEDYLSEVECRKINEYVRGTLVNAFTIDGFDYSSWKGVSLGQYFYYKIKDFAILQIRNLICARACIAEIMPDRIYMGDGLGFSPPIWKDEALNSGVDCIVLNENPAVEIQAQWMPLKKRDQNLRGQTTKIHTLRDRLHKKGRAVVDGFKNDVRILLESKKRQFRRPAVLMHSVNPGLKMRLTEKLESAGFSSFEVNGGYRLSSSIRLKRRLIEYFQRNRQLFMSCGEHANELKYDGLDLWPYFKNYLMRFFIRMPELALEVECFRTFIKKGDYLLFVAPFSSGGIFRLRCAVCKQENVPILLYQSGYANGFYSNIEPAVDVNYALCWAPHHVDYYQEIGLKENNIIRTKANFTTLFSHAWDTVYTREELGIVNDKKNILFPDTKFENYDALVSPFDVLVENINEFINAAREMPDVNFIVKFHPGLYDGESIQKRVNVIESVGLNNLKIAPLDSNPNEFLDQCDICVMYVSTLGIEFMLNDKFAIMLNFGGKRSPWALKNNSDIPITITEPGGLKEKLQLLLNDDSAKQNARLAQEKLLHDMLIESDVDEADAVVTVAKKELNKRGYIHVN